MHKKILCLLMTLGLCAAILALPLSAAKEEHSVSAKTYFYDQLTDGGKQIYDALADPAHLDALMAGEAVTVDRYAVAIPEGVNQQQFDELVGTLTAEQQRLGALMHYATDAAAAINRDRSDIFWTNGVHARVAFAIDGEIQSGNLSITPGHEYAVLLLVSLPVVEDWDADGQYDRDLQADIEELRAAVLSVAEGARSHASTRHDRLRYINDLLCNINQYHTEAANAAAYPQYYPWTALAALSPLDTENDSADGSLMPVCEGYARALKLICDELEIPCLLVSGDGNGENHMWNSVQLEDGNWYAMDVTWNDTAHTDRYFLQGAAALADSHLPSGVFIPEKQTVTFSYPTLSQADYVVPTTAVGIVLPELPTPTEGYGTCIFPITLSNYGTLPATLQELSLDTYDAMDLMGLPLTDILEAGTTNSAVSIALKNGLAPGTYTATLTLRYGDGLTATETVTVTILEAPSVEEPPNDPPVSNETPSDPSSDTQNPPSALTPSDTTPEAEITLPDKQDTEPAVSRLGCRAALPTAALCLVGLAPAWALLRKRHDN